MIKTNNIDQKQVKMVKNGPNGGNKSSHRAETLSSTNLYIRGLQQNCTDDDLYKMCEPHGKIVSTKAIVHPFTNMCKGYGFVVFDKQHEAMLAVQQLKLNGMQAQLVKFPNGVIPNGATDASKVAHPAPVAVMSKTRAAGTCNTPPSDGSTCSSTTIRHSDVIGIEKVHATSAKFKFKNKDSSKLLQGDPGTKYDKSALSEFEVSKIEVKFSTSWNDDQEKVLGVKKSSFVHAGAICYQEGIGGSIGQKYDQVLDNKTNTIFAVISREDAKKHCVAKWKENKVLALKDSNVQEDEIKLLHSRGQQSYFHYYGCSSALPTYLSEVTKRREELYALLEENGSSFQTLNIPDELIGVEHQLVASLTYSIMYEPGKKGLYVDLLSVREFYQSLGIGRWLMEHMKELMRAGGYDYISLYPVKEAENLYTGLGFEFDPDHMPYKYAMFYRAEKKTVRKRRNVIRVKELPSISKRNYSSTTNNKRCKNSSMKDSQDIPLIISIGRTKSEESSNSNDGRNIFESLNAFLNNSSQPSESGNDQGILVRKPIDSPDSGNSSNSNDGRNIFERLNAFWNNSSQPSDSANDQGILVRKPIDSPDSGNSSSSNDGANIFDNMNILYKF